MNTGFYKDLDTNFETACELIGEKYSHNELIEFLKTGNIPQRQMAALRLDGVFSQEDAESLINNLTGCDGKIREAAALRILQLLKENPDSRKFFKVYPEIFSDASIDINANICRLVTDSVSILKSEQNFAQIYLDKILGFIDDAFCELDKFIYKDKKYLINKQLFKLYWCLEDLKLFIDIIDKEILFGILARTSDINEYTVREKAANILHKIEDKKFMPLKEKLMSDENYYVREAFNKNH